MKLQRAQQADHRLRHLAGHSHQAFMLRRARVRQPVQAAGRPFQFTARRHARENDARYARIGQVAGAQQAVLADELKHSLGVGRRCMHDRGRHQFGLIPVCSKYSSISNNRRN